MHDQFYSLHSQRHKVLQKVTNLPDTGAFQVKHLEKPTRIFALVTGLRLMCSHMVICTQVTQFWTFWNFQAGMPLIGHNDSRGHNDQ